MEILTIDDLKKLIRIREEYCISLFLPTERGGREVRQNSIRFKNLVRKAAEELISEGMKEREIEELLKPASSIQIDKIFWQQQLDGLAMFLKPRLFRYYRLPLDFEELVVVGRRFHLKPLLSLFSGNGRFYLLALTRRQVRLFLGSHYSVNEVRLRQVPRSLAEAMKFDEVEKQIQYHTGTGAARQDGRRAAVYHGQGAGKAEVKDQLLRYFRGIDRAVHRALRNEQAPLVLAGLPYLLPIYSEANSYPNLLEEGVGANADELSVGELHEKAWEVVGPYFRRKQEQSAERFGVLASTDKASDRLEEIVPAAAYGKVDTLFVPKDLHSWGSYDPKKQRIVRASEPGPENEDLLDLAAVQTLVADGTVYTVNGKEVPGNKESAAIFRY